MSKVKDHSGKNTKTKDKIQNNRYSDLVRLALIIILGIIIYSNTFHCSFQFDDYPNIVDNPKVQHLEDVSAWWNFNPTRPIGIFTFVLNYHFNKVDVRYYHLVNLLIHIINALLVWWLTRLIFSAPALQGQPIVRYKNDIAFITALLFVSHPIATQAVTYIVQRLASLAALFYLLSVALYIKARLPDKHHTFKFILFAGSILAAILAMLTKENAFTLPFAILLTEVFLLRTSPLPGLTKKFEKKYFSLSPAKFFAEFRRVILHVINFLRNPAISSAKLSEKKNNLSDNPMRVKQMLFTSFIVIFIIFLFYKFPLSIFNPILPEQGHLYTITPKNYLFTEFSVIVKYLQLFILPLHQNLDHDFPISNHFFELRTFLSFLFLAGLIILAVVVYKKARIISFGIFWFFLTLSVESSFIPIPNVIFEHRAYLPSFGFFLILTSVIYLLFWMKYKALAISMVVIIIGTNSILTYERNKVWKDNLTLWSDAALKSPNKARPLVNRGIAFRKLGQWDRAIDDFTKALQINPDYLDASYNRGLAYSNTGQWENSVIDFTRVIRINPVFSEAYSNRGSSYGNLGQFDKAIDDFTKAIALDPQNALAWFNRGVTYTSLGEWDKAIADYTKTLVIDPGNSRAYSLREEARRNAGINAHD